MIKEVLCVCLCERARLDVKDKTRILNRNWGHDEVRREESRRAADFSRWKQREDEEEEKEEEEWEQFSGSSLEHAETAVPCC